MRGLLKIGLVVAALLTLMVACGGETTSWRQKVVLEVETPQGIVSGGSVVEVSIYWKSAFETAGGLVGGVANEHRGEASFVEVAPGKYLFARTLKDPNALAYATFKEPSDNAKGRNPMQELGRRLEHLNKTRPVPRPYYPMLVTFDDITKPETVKLVDPANLAATFGTGYALKSIQLKITDEKVTEGEVEKVLGWIKDRNPVFLENWKDFPADHPLRNISKFSFKTGE